MKPVYQQKQTIKTHKINPLNYKLYRHLIQPHQLDLICQLFLFPKAQSRKFKNNPKMNTNSNSKQTKFIIQDAPYFPSTKYSFHYHRLLAHMFTHPLRVNKFLLALLQRPLPYVYQIVHRMENEQLFTFILIQNLEKICNS